VVQNCWERSSSGRVQAVRFVPGWGVRMATKRLGASKPRVESPESAVATEFTSWF
jgi:hypothetical protein